MVVVTDQVVPFRGFTISFDEVVEIVSAVGELHFTVIEGIVTYSPIVEGYEISEADGILHMDLIGYVVVTDHTYILGVHTIGGGCKAEKAFDVYKTDLDEKRNRTGNPERVRGRFFIKFIALMMRSHIQNILREHDCNIVTTKAKKDSVNGMTVDEVFLSLNTVFAIGNTGTGG